MLAREFNKKTTTKKTTKFLNPIGQSAIVEYMVDSDLSTKSETITAFEILGCALVQLLKFNDAVNFWRKALLERY
jgi:hypothetical protein